MHYVHYTKRNAAEHLSAALTDELIRRNTRELVVVCIGTDRSTGDSLGPLVGTFLKEAPLPEWVSVYGTLDFPVHALNLTDCLDMVTRCHPNAIVLAVDSALGLHDHIGYIELKNGSLKPGAGVGKRLPPVGDLSLKGVVNAGGFMEYFALQNTRLSVVMKMARVMSEIIWRAVINVDEAMTAFDYAAVTQ